LDLSRLSLDQLGKLVQDTSPLVSGAKSVQESNQELAQANKELKAVLEQGLLRESNIQITVPVGSQETVFLP
jgi:hypothetical protein